MKKKPALPLLSLALALVSLALSLLALFSQPEDQSHLIDDLYRENALLRRQIQELSARLEDALPDTDATCSFSVLDWTMEAGTLILTDANARLQLPPAAGTIREANLLLRRSGGEEIRVPVTLIPGESNLSGLVIPVDALAQGESLELCLEILLSDGRTLTAFGISWFLDGDTLISAVG